MVCSLFQVAFGDGCDTVTLDLDDGEMEIAEKLAKLENLAGAPLRVSTCVPNMACNAPHPMQLTAWLLLLGLQCS